MFFSCKERMLLIVLLVAVFNEQPSDALTCGQLVRNKRLLCNLEADDQGDGGTCRKDYCRDKVKCSINYDLIDPEAIEQTRDENLKCSYVKICCDDVRTSSYRTSDGSCNNMKNPSWGKVGSCLRRLLPYDYEDGISLPRASCTGGALPNVRNISNHFHRELKRHIDVFTLIFLEIGQFIAHDVSKNDIFRIPGTTTPIRCCTNGPNISEQCISAAVPPDDPFYIERNVTCLNIMRTVPCPRCTTGKRQHSNNSTHYLDLSTVYGSTKDVAMSLRTMKNGKLIVQENDETGPLLPGVPKALGCTALNNDTLCFKSGDDRTQQNTLLLCFHTMFMRHHNNVCSKLEKLNPHWNDEKLYQEARRICIAQFQMIVYGHYLPKILGPCIMKDDNLNTQPYTTYTTYNPWIDASTLDEFSAVAQRFGHNQIPEEVHFVNPKTGCTYEESFSDNYFSPFQFYNGSYDQEVMGMTRYCERKQDRFFVSEVRNFLYKPRSLKTPGGDLVSTTISRGRDHGIPSYPHYLLYCFDYTVRDFCDLEKFMPCKRVELLKNMYKTVYDVDLYVAGLFEYKVKGGLVGPTFACILRKQYYVMKYGDRFYFEHDAQTGSFKHAQLKAIKDTRMEKIICETTMMEEIQENVFYPPSKRNPMMPCCSIPDFDYSSFKDGYCSNCHHG